MAPIKVPSVQLLRSLKDLSIKSCTRPHMRKVSTTSVRKDLVQIEKQSFFSNPKPETVFIPRLERKLIARGTLPIGSRRRRMALAQSQNVPFDQLPYQCFQEARQILIADRDEKLHKIGVERARIARLQESNANVFTGGEPYKQRRIKSMQDTLEKLKILADINDPGVKRRFEDGKGDLSKPIYRHLAERRWRGYRRKIAVQRITQFNIVPDVVPHLDPTVDIKFAFGSKAVQPGSFVESKTSETPCRLQIQSFEREEKLVTIAIVDSDIPNLEKDGFDTRCLFLAVNVSILPTSGRCDLSRLGEHQVLLPWAAPYAQKGSPYHRLSIVVLQQKDNIPIDLDVALQKVQRDEFSVRSLMTRHMLHPIGGTLFRIKWDDSMFDVMKRAGTEDGNGELKRRKIEPLPYQRRNPSTFR